jgi:hypothetical protein
MTPTSWRVAVPLIAGVAASSTSGHRHVDSTLLMNADSAGMSGIDQRTMLLQGIEGGAPSRSDQVDQVGGPCSAGASRKR